MNILDTETYKITDYCVPQEPDFFLFPRAPISLWSPDSKQLLLLDGHETYHNRVIWVSPEQGLTVQMTEEIDMTGVISQPMWGWMSTLEE